MDYEHQPANHLAFRLAARVIVPRAFPDASLRRFGARARKVRRYNGTKEDVYLADFKPDPEFNLQLRALGVESTDVLIVVRPPAREALYHRFENELFYAAHATPSFIVPERALDGANLIAAADLVVSAGGTMNREAAALGVPAATIYAGR
jgi:predicted glycosyltransferase